MELILLERVAKLGQMGDVVSVKQGYARNFLLPRKKALRASQTNIDAFEAQKAQLEARNLETRKEAESLAGRLEGKIFVVIRSASDTGSLYGSVSPRDAAEAATELGISLDRKQIRLAAPIKELGVHEVLVTLHPEVDVTIKLNIARSADEAELQESGGSILDLAAREDKKAKREISKQLEEIGSSMQIVDVESGHGGPIEDFGPAGEKPPGEDVATR